MFAGASFGGIEAYINPPRLLFFLQNLHPPSTSNNHILSSRLIIHYNEVVCVCFLNLLAQSAAIRTSLEVFHGSRVKIAVSLTKSDTDLFSTIFHGSFALGIIWYQDFITPIAVRFIFQDVFFIEVLAYLFVLPSYMVSAFRKFGGWLCIITKENNIHLMTGWSHHVVDRQTSSSEHMWQQRNNTRSDETSGCPTENALLSPMFFFSHISNLSSGRITHSHLLEPTKHSHHPHSWFSPPFLESTWPWRQSHQSLLLLLSFRAFSTDWSSSLTRPLRDAHTAWSASKWSR